MTASDKAKQHGFRSLVPVIERSKVPRQTLNDWDKTRPRLVELILMGLKFEHLYNDLHKFDYSTRKAIETYVEIEKL